MSADKWQSIVRSPERVDLVKRLIDTIIREGRARGHDVRLYNMHKALERVGVTVGKDYMAGHLRVNNPRSHPFPFEVIVGLCTVYGIPLSVIFNPELFTDSPEL